KRKPLTGGKLVTPKDIETIYAKGRAGRRSAILLRELADHGKKFESFDELASTLSDNLHTADTQKKIAKAAILDYLSKPNCPAFSVEGNKNKKLGLGDIDELYNIEKSGSGTVALLNSLETGNKKANTFAELVTLAKTASKGKRD